MNKNVWNINSNNVKSAIICCFILLISACSTRFDMEQGKTLGAVKEHQKIFIIEYETSKEWLDYNDIRDDMFSQWILNGFNELLTQNNLQVDGVVYPKENRKQVKKQIKSKLKAFKPDGLLVIIPKSAHGLMDSSSGNSHQISDVTYRFEFFTYENKKQVKVWESTGNYTLPDVMYADDPEKLYHAYADVYVNEVLTELQKSGFIKPITLFEIK